jgi:hypothetical protein
MLGRTALPRLAHEADTWRLATGSHAGSLHGINLRQFAGPA